MLAQVEGMQTRCGDISYYTFERDVTEAELRERLEIITIHSGLKGYLRDISGAGSFRKLRGSLKISLDNSHMFSLRMINGLGSALRQLSLIGRFVSFKTEKWKIDAKEIGSR